MPDYQNIVRASFRYATAPDESLHIADETNCVRWIPLRPEPREEPFTWPCERCGKQHNWRTAWVIA